MILQREVKMQQANSGDTVRIHYTAKLESGKYIDSSKKREPVKLTISDRGVLSGISEGIIGMSIGETKTIILPPEKACGPRRQKSIFNLKKSDLPKNYRPIAGQHIKLKRPNGKIVKATVADIAEDTVTVDTNSPLAGKTLIFDIELLEIA